MLIRMRTALFLAVLAIWGHASPGDADAAKPEWKPKSGSSSKYRWTNRHKADFGNGAKPMIVEWDLTVLVASVDGNRVTLKVDNTEPRVTFDGKENADMQVQVGDTEDVLALSGEVILQDGNAASGHAIEFALFGGFRFPPVELEEGKTTKVHFPGSEKHGKPPISLTYTFRGKEKVGQWESVKIEFEFAEDTGESPIKAKGTIWLSAEDGSLIQRKSSVSNVDFGAGPETVEQEILRIG